MSATLAFLFGRAPSDYGALLSRLRWRRAVRSDRELALDLSEPAAEAFGSPREDDTWTLVREPASIPVARGIPAATGGGGPTGSRAFAGSADGILRAVTRFSLDASAGAAGAAVHTLRELEAVRFSGPGMPGLPPAVLLRPHGTPALPGETVGAYFERVAARATARRADSEPGDGCVVLQDPSELERPELSARIPEGRRRLVDAGCGGGATSGALRVRRPGLSVTGLEKNPEAAARARGRLDRVLEGDAAVLLRDLARAGERFDSFLFGDVLEHMSDPVSALSAARAAAEPGAILVASVPNVGHLSIVRDLVLGRFDPVPAGLLDAGHLRWFTRSFLAEALEEAGWRVTAVEGVAGAPPPDPGSFLDALGTWPEMDRESLSTYQWIAVASAEDAA